MPYINELLCWFATAWLIGFFCWLAERRPATPKLLTRKTR